MEHSKIKVKCCFCSALKHVVEYEEEDYTAK